MRTTRFFAKKTGRWVRKSYSIGIRPLFTPYSASMNVSSHMFCTLDFHDPSSIGGRTCVPVPDFLGDARSRNHVEPTMPGITYIYIYIYIYMYIILYVYIYIYIYISYCVYIYIYIYIYGPVLRLSTPPPGVGSPGSSPNSLLFASYWQHFWGPAAYLLGLCSIWLPASHLLDTCYLLGGLRSTHTPSKYLRATYSHIYMCYVSTVSTSYLLPVYSDNTTCV